jgi:heme-degrading monooxygenase HmoA
MPLAQRSVEENRAWLALFSAFLESVRLPEINSSPTRIITMFIRHVSMRLREDCVTRFARILGAEVIPLLRDQDGFLDYITLISPERSEAVVITFWETEESEESFVRTRNPEVSRSLFDVIEGTPRVDTFDILDSTFPHLAAQRA